MTALIWIIVPATLGILFFGMRRVSKNNHNPLFQAMEGELMGIVIEGGNSLDESAHPKIEAVLKKYGVSTMDVIHVTTMMDAQLALLAYSKPQIKDISNTILEIDAKRRN